MLELVFETHSISTDNERGVATGWHHGELSERGRRLAAELGERRRRDGLSAVFSSDLRRAAETAEIAFDRSTVPVLLDWRLRECDYGALNGAPVEQIERQRRRRIDDRFPEGESYRDAVVRVESLLEDLLARWDGSRVLLIGHSATRWALDHLLAGAALQDLDAPFDWREGWEYRVEGPR